MNLRKTKDKGADFEEVLRNYFDHSGFYALRGVPFRFDGDDITDVDVWLYERPNAMSRRRAVVDAKNKQRPKAVERVLWARGFKEGLGVETAIVATTDRRASVKKFASSVGVTVLDGEALQRLSTSNSLKNYRRIPLDTVLQQIAKIDGSREEKEWRTRFDNTRASLLTRLGFLSANENIDASHFFLD